MRWRRKFLINHDPVVNSVKLRWRKINIIHLKKETLYFYKTVRLEKHQDVAAYSNNNFKVLKYKSLTTITKLVNVMINLSIHSPSHRAHKQTLLTTAVIRNSTLNQLNKLKLEYATKYIQLTQIKVQKIVLWLIKTTGTMDPFTKMKFLFKGKMKKNKKKK